MISSYAEDPHNLSNCVILRETIRYRYEYRNEYISIEGWHSLFPSVFAVYSHAIKHENSRVLPAY